MALATYTDLKTAVADWLNRSDLTDVIPDYISLVEAELGRILQGRPMRTTLAVTYDTTGTLAVPVDFVRPVSLTLEISTANWPIEVKPYEFIVQKRGQLVNGAPRYVALVGDTFQFAPIPDSTTTYTGNLVYDAALAPLSSTQTTNWVLTKHPDVYLYGALMQAAPYLKDDDRIPVWEGRYRSAVEQIRVLAAQSEYGFNTPIARGLSALGE